MTPVDVAILAGAAVAWVAIGCWVAGVWSQAHPRRRRYDPKRDLYSRWTCLPCGEEGDWMPLAKSIEDGRRHFALRHTPAPVDTVDL